MTADESKIGPPNAARSVPRLVYCEPQGGPLSESVVPAPDGATWVGVQYGEEEHEVVRLYVESDGRITLDTLAMHIDITPEPRKWSAGTTAVFNVRGRGEDAQSFLDRWGDV